MQQRRREVAKAGGGALSERKVGSMERCERGAAGAAGARSVECGVGIEVRKSRNERRRSAALTPL
jgi:hypothetical protein